MSPSIVVDRCTLRVVRRGGWSWGADPRRLLRGVLEALPALVAARLAELLAGAVEGEIAEPVRIRLPLRLAELLAAGGLAGGRPEMAAFVARLDRALAAEVLPQLMPSAAVPEPAVPPAVKASLPPPEVPAPILLLRRLLDWRAVGALDALLSRLPATAAERWLVALAAGEPPANRPGVSEEEIDRLLARRRDELASRRDPFAPAVLRLLLIIEAAAKLAVPAGDRALAAVLDRLAPLPASRVGPAPPASEPAPPTPDEAERQVPEGRAPAVARRVSSPEPDPVPGLVPRLAGEVRVASVLPWLLLGPLSKIGVLETLAAVLELAGLGTSAPCFAAALAHKVLEPPGRGWLRSPAAAATAAAFAGLEEPLPEPLLGRFAAGVDDFVALLDADLARATLAGHPAGGPLFLWRLPAQGGFLVLDPDGLFPAAWEETVEDLRPVLALAGRSPLLVPEPAADPATLAGLDAAGARFVTPAPPTRVEPWQRQPGPGRWWTNRPAAAAPALRRAMARVEELAAQAAELAEEVVVRRPAIAARGARAPGSALERSVTLAAAAALGTIAWTLWREREATDPQLALARFADLDGVVRFSGERIRVRLPLGRRHRDLCEHGLLAGVAGVPWLGGRGVEFSGG